MPRAIWSLPQKMASIGCRLWSSRVTASRPHDSVHNARFVYVLGEDRLTPPVQGLVIAWRRYSYKWSALVCRVDESLAAVSSRIGWRLALP
jgi:hypothetical protein